MYSSHPSKRLNDLFENKPFQGQEPERAKILFIGLDANYASNIESCEIFEKIQEYHSDGVAFWQMHGVHHPFLLPEYSGDGRKYHRNFARIGFTPNDAELISFVELLHVPTVGRNKIALADLSPSHLQRLNSWILTGGCRQVFISSGVASLMYRSRTFPWLPRIPIGSYDSLGVYWSERGKTVFSYLHFSNYGKFEERLRYEATSISKLRKQVCAMD